MALIEERLPRSGSYDVKPSVLLDGLNSGVEACLWLDTDVLINGNLDFLAAEREDTVIVTQDPWEYADGSTFRCGSWGLQAGRSLPGPLNSAVVRVTALHRPMLEAWHALLSTEVYLAEQAKPIPLRDRNILGDQDALSALLASQQFAGVPVRRLRHASEILQHHGAGAYGFAQRWQTLRHGLPPLIHAMGTVKPWKMPDRPSLTGQPRVYYERVYLELSPYLHLARQYRAELQEEAAWLDIQTIAGRLATIATVNQPALKGLWQAVLHRPFSGH